MAAYVPSVGLREVDIQRKQATWLVRMIPRITNEELRDFLRPPHNIIAAVTLVK